MAKQCSRNKQYSLCECVENVEIPESIKEIKIFELIGIVTGIKVNQNCRESCHPRPSDKKKKIIVKFLTRKNAESVLRNKNKNKKFNPRSKDIDSNKTFVNEGLCRYYEFIWSKCK